MEEDLPEEFDLIVLGTGEWKCQGSDDLDLPCCAFSVQVFPKPSLLQQPQESANLSSCWIRKWTYITDTGTTLKFLTKPNGIYRVINQSINQSITRLANQSMNQSNDLWVSQLMYCFNQSIN
jgi:hypothetical protein